MSRSLRELLKVLDFDERLKYCPDYFSFTNRFKRLLLLPERLEASSAMIPVPLLTRLLSYSQSYAAFCC